MGVFILWFCWFGFNGGSTVSASGDDTLILISSIFVKTNLAAAAAATSTMIITWLRYKKPDVSMTLNGALGGLVAVTAGCDAVSATGALIIGILSGFIIVFGIEFIDKELKVDDPVGAIGVHGLCGAAGTILTGVFAQNGGLLYSGELKMLGIQTLGVLAVTAWVAITMTAVFYLIKHTVGLRVSKEEEIAGLDIAEHGIISSYADFMPPASGDDTAVAPLADTPKIEYNLSKTNAKMTKIVIITKQSKFDSLKAAMDGIGITGMTVTQVLGCGMQRGSTEYYRGSPLEINLLPKVKVEIVVCKIPVSTVIEAAKKALHTGNIGDGKLFTFNVENVVKIRTGEEDYDALQDDIEVEL
ncbi:ammonium transporter [Acetivibrio straminisolvens JCM 21531]|uniref:Ammonium transporter n=1 Tax=Acetivibrio straminisolvens JCM 21531 TaxID=1294263 RepID=W4V1Q8_9FIRM|nr:ammonium transporter [Acetivibrio straminisolvens JCM 21531]